MPRKRHTAEQVISKLREAEVELGRGLSVADVCRKLEVTEQTYYRWRKEYGGLKLDGLSPAGTGGGRAEVSDQEPPIRR
jgi:putative transposase